MVAPTIDDLSGCVFDDAHRLDALLYAAIGEFVGYSWTNCDEHYDIPHDIREGAHYLRDQYRRSSPPYYGMEVAASYALRYFPQNYLKARNALMGVAELGRDQAELKVLDLGSGPGTMALSLIDALRLCGRGRSISVTYVDRSLAMATLAAHMLACRASCDTAAPCDRQVAHLHESIDANFCLPDTVRRVADDGPYDFVAFGNCLGETFGAATPSSVWAAQAASIVITYAALLGDGGSLLVMEPALLRLVDGMSELREILLSHASLSELAWSGDERLSDAQHHAMPSICQEILGAEVARAWEDGTPSAFLLLRKEPAA